MRLSSTNLGLEYYTLQVFQEVERDLLDALIDHSIKPEPTQEEATFCFAFAVVEVQMLENQYQCINW
jgi:hypothetical protein